VATQINSQTSSPTRLKGAVPSAAQSFAEEIRPAMKLDAAALSAGVKVVMGKDAAPEASAETAAADAATEATDEAGSALMASSAALDAVEETGLIERQSVEARLPVQLDVGIPIRDFRVKHLLVLEPGSLIESSWVPGEDVPVASGDVQLAWSEFEVVDTHLAVRLTRLT
jgi:flagellar motor switch/type III secretory pathway protein FliN